MSDLRTVVVAMAVIGAGVATAAALGKLSGRLGDRTVNGLYYLAYGCTGLSALLFIVDGLFAPRP